MYRHHEESIKNLIEMYQDNKRIFAIILAGSIAKGKEKSKSDIDIIMIVSDDMYDELVSENKRSECIFEGCTYENGYFDIKYFTKDFIVKAAEKGSEPTRNSFVGARCIYSVDEQIESIISKIPRYPVWEKEDRIRSFYSALILNEGYFWSQVKKTQDTYLKLRTASDIVLFGMRMLYAYNEMLFPCHKWLLRTATELEQKPDNIIEKANLFLEKLDDGTKDDFVNSILNFCDWNLGGNFSPLSRFVMDNEQWWYHNRPNIVEW